VQEVRNLKQSLRLNNAYVELQDALCADVAHENDRLTAENSSLRHTISGYQRAATQTLRLGGTLAYAGTVAE
jgi:hypothetical protein